MANRRILVIGGAIASAIVFAASASYVAAEKSGGWWSGFDTAERDNFDYDLSSSGYVVIDMAKVANGGASAAEAAGNSDADIGPVGRKGLPSLSSDVILDEDGDDEAGEDSAPAEVRWDELRIKPGDTLSQIAEKSGIPVKDIMRANELKNEHRLAEGQVLFIPKSTDAVLDTLAYIRSLKAKEIAKRKQADKLEITYYVVKDGDSLWSVANEFDLDVNTLFGSNKLGDADVLKPGTTLRIPNQDGIFIKVRKGATIEKVAQDYGTFVEAIRSANGIEAGDSLVAGKEIFLPGAKVVAYVDTAGKGKTAIAKSVKDRVVASRGYGWPVRGQISSRFGWRRDPIRGRRDFHTGLDIRAPRGTAIVAAASGRVVYAGWMGGYGRTVVVSHSDGTTTLYGHCSSLIARSGQSVKRGQAIARVGSTGRSTGNHVHFEVRRGGSPINPLRVIR